MVHPIGWSISATHLVMAPPRARWYTIAMGKEIRGDRMLRGHPIYDDGERYRYRDTGEPTAENWRQRPCGKCDRPTTTEGHDGCLGTLPGVVNACCGHGSVQDAYVQLMDGTRLSGMDAVAYQDEHGP